jgi:hypothetical protein
MAGMHAKSAASSLAAISFALVALFDSGTILSAQGSRYGPAATNLPNAPAASDIFSGSGLPAFSTWMYGPDFLPAHWLGLSFEGRTLREPINVVIQDTYSKTPEEAVSVLMAACREAGFPETSGHSTGYYGYIADRFYGQIPEGKRMAFSDGLPEFSNDHGRIFGPFYATGSYWFIGAFSKENVHPTSKVPHHFVSFDQARDAFASRMEHRAGYETLGYLFLGNFSLRGSKADYGTGDHDGVAIFLGLRDPTKPRPQRHERNLPVPPSLKP